MEATEQRIIMTREQAHAKLDGIFDALDKLGLTNGGQYHLQRIMLTARPDDSITGCILVERTHGMLGLHHVTWGINPYEAGLHSGHYDLSEEDGETDWLRRTQRGW